MAKPMFIHYQYNRVVGLAGAECRIPCKCGYPCFYEIVAAIATLAVHIPSPRVADYGVNASIDEMIREVALIQESIGDLIDGLNRHANTGFFSFDKVDKVETFLKKRMRFLKYKIKKDTRESDSSDSSDSDSSDLSDF